MTEVVSIRFKNRGKAYYFDPAGLQIQVGDSVIVDTANGMDGAAKSNGKDISVSTDGRTLNVTTDPAKLYPEKEK